MTEPITWAAVGMAAVSSMATWLIILKKNSKKTTSNPGSNPGEGKTCREHGEAISGLVEFKENTGTALVRIEGKVDLLLGRKG